MFGCAWQYRVLASRGANHEEFASASRGDDAEVLFGGAKKEAGESLRALNFRTSETRIWKNIPNETTNPAP